MMKLLHWLPPEVAHAVTLWGVGAGLAPRLDPDSATVAWPCLREAREATPPLPFLARLVNPVGLAAGADKQARALGGWCAMGFGFVECGTVTRHARPGNPRPRLWRFPEERALVNWLGLPGEGLEPFVGNLRRFEARPERARLVVGASVASPEDRLDDLEAVAEACAPHVDYLTLNASCPNLRHGDDEVTEHLQRIAAQVEAVKSAAARRTQACVPVLVKLAPTRDLVALARVAEAARGAGVDGFVASNTLPAAERGLVPPLALTWPERAGAPAGGYSGPLLLDLACDMVAALRRLLGPSIPIVGVGGIQSGEDGLRMLSAGANAVQLYTGLVYRGPRLIPEVLEALRSARRQPETPRPA